MNLIFPDFSDVALVEFGVCAIFAADPPSRLDGLPKRSLLQTRYEVDGSSVWARVAVDVNGDRGHVHFDFGRDGRYSQRDDFELKTAQEIGTFLRPFEGQVARVELNAEYAVDFESLPQHGIIATLCGVSTESCGSTMALDGASMAIDGDQFYRMRWTRDYEDDTVCAELFASSECEINERYLVDLAETMQDGLCCFVFENSETQSGTGNDSGSDDGTVQKKSG